MVATPGFALLALYALSAALAALVLAASVRAWRLTGLPHLPNFIAGFALLEASYLAVLLNRLVWPLGWGYHTTLWVHELAQLAAFALLASSYLGRSGALTPSRSRGLQAGAAVLILLGLAAFLALPQPVAWAGRNATAALLYALAALPLALVILAAARGLRGRGRGAVLVPAGFAAWVAGQALWLGWAWTHDWALVVGANVAFVGGLALLAAALVPAWRPHGIARAA